MLSLTLTETMEEVQALLNLAKEKALKAVETQRHQNPALNQIGQCCYTIRVSDLSKDLILSPHYYDFNWQYDLLISKLQLRGVEHFVPYVKKVVEEKKIDSYKIHPEVIKSLEEIL